MSGKTPSLLMKTCLVMVLAAVVMAEAGFRPNEDTAPRRRDTVVGTGDGPETASGKVRRQDRIIESRSAPLYEPRSAPEVQMPFAYPDVNLDGQEFFPRKPAPGQRPQVYQPGADDQPPNVYQPDRGPLGRDAPQSPTSPFIYRPESR